MLHLREHWGEYRWNEWLLLHSEGNYSADISYKLRIGMNQGRIKVGGKIDFYPNVKEWGAVLGFDVPVWPTVHGFTQATPQHSEKHSPVSFINTSASEADRSGCGGGEKVAASLLDCGMGLLLAHKIFVRSLNRRLPQPDWIDLKQINSSTGIGNKQQD